ncbi:MAG: toll/interleukin-1 receptor domain-containing protein, partial [Cyanobacteriota bacterium]
MAHLFLSHSSADDGFVRELRDALADLDQPVWIDSRQLKGGDPLWGEIQAAIGASAGLAVLVSPDALQSDWVARELKYALELQAERGRAAFPVLLLALNGTNPASLAGYFDVTAADIPV